MPVGVLHSNRPFFGLQLSFFGLPVSFGVAAFGAFGVAAFGVAAFGGVVGCGELAAGVVVVGVVVAGAVVVAVVDVPPSFGGAQSPFVVTLVRNDVSPRVTVTFVTPDVEPGIVDGLTLSAA